MADRILDNCARGKLVSAAASAMADHVSDFRVEEKPVAIKQERRDNHHAAKEQLHRIPNIKEEPLHIKQEDNEDYCPITKAISPPVSEAQKKWNDLRNSTTALRRLSHLNPTMATIVAPSAILNGKVRKRSPADARLGFCCSIQTCKRKFKRQGLLEDHYRRAHHSTDMLERHCVRCGILCKGAEALASHMQGHDMTMNGLRKAIKKEESGR